MLKVFVTIGIIVFLAGGVSAATYSWYFSDDNSGNPMGNDANPCTQASPCKTLHKLQERMLTLGSSDVANVYLDRGDQWIQTTPNICNGALCSGWTSNSDHVLGFYDGTVHLDAYGSGNKPIIDGGLTSWNSDPTTGSSSTGPTSVDEFIHIERSGTTIKNIVFRNYYRNGIRFRAPSTTKGIHDVEISNCEIYNFGGSAISPLPAPQYDYYNNLVENNLIYDINQMWLYGYYDWHTKGWGSAIALSGVSSGGDASGNGGMYYGNVVRGNIVYNVYGEGILVHPGPGPTGLEETIIENNIVGDTWKIGIYFQYATYDTGIGIIRNNIIYGTQEGRADYSIWGGQEPSGVSAWDETGTGYDNSMHGDLQIYGNIVIGRSFGMIPYCDHYNFHDDPLGHLRISNNLIIDSTKENYYFDGTCGAEQVLDFDFKNNALIYFDQSGQPQINEDHNPLPDYSNSDITNNFYWNEVAQSYGSVDNNWQTGMLTGDPNLPGEPSVNWDGLTSYTDIDFTRDLYPPANSPLNQIGITKDYLQNICEGLPIDLGCGATSIPTCPQGQITSNCLCQGVEYSSGYCCIGGWQSTTCPVPTQELIAYYTMDSADISGGVVLDKSGNGIDATIYGNPQSATGRISESLHFDGFDDYLDTGYTNDLHQWTVAVWVRGDNDPGNLIDTGPVMKQENFLISWDHMSSSFRSAAGLSVGGTWHPSSFGNMIDRTWYHLAATYDGESLRAYRDGNLITQNTAMSGAPDSSAYSMKIARHSIDEYYFAGSVDEVKVFNYALTDSEITALASSNCITVPQLVNYMEQWKSNQITISDLLLVIQDWKRGC